MAFLSRQAIIDADDLKTVDVEVPEWGGTVRLKMLTGQQRDQFEASMVKVKKDGSSEPNLQNARARLVSLCAIEVNPDGTNGPRMFQSQQDVILLGNKSSAAVSRLYNECNELNGFTQKDVEELEEGFDDAPSEGSTGD